MINSALQREPLYRQIYRILERRILSGELTVGDVIPAEQTLADSLQVNRSSVREALRLLEENGLVGRKLGGKKLRVRLPDHNQLGNRISNSMILEAVSFGELYEAMRVIDGDIGEMAAGKISKLVLDKLAENIRQTELNLNDAAALLALDYEFHSLVAEGTANRVMQLSRLGIAQLFFPAVNRLIKASSVNHRLLAAHQRIYEGLRNHDPVHTRLWVSKHIDDFKRGYEVAGLDIDAPVVFMPNDEH